MAATVVSAIPDLNSLRGIQYLTITIPTTVDGAAGSLTTIAIQGRATAIEVQADSSNFNAKTLTVKGSLDGTNFYDFASAVSFTASGMKSVGVSAEMAVRFLQIAFSGAPLATLTVKVAVNLQV